MTARYPRSDTQLIASVFTHRCRTTAALVLMATVALVGCSDGSDGNATIASEAIELLPLSTQGNRIVDAQGRDVLLRGVNVTSLGEYWQGDANHEPTQAMTAADWDAMSARGFSVIRLVVSWSRIEPERGVIDEAYLDDIEAYVDAAAARGMYTVIDMHQDAFSAFISTPEGEVCPEGSAPAKGWDGAPQWATLTDGLSTCITGDRNSSPAVIAAWNHFYDNTDGIRDRFVASWAAVAARFAGRPEVAGYNLLNEPDTSRPAAQIEPLYDALIRDTVNAIRAVEADAPFQHLLFVEPTLPAGNLAHGLVFPDPGRVGIDSANFVSAPHNYAESIIQGLTVEAMNAWFTSVAAGFGVPTWIGEYGWWDTGEASLEELNRMARDLDARGLGGAWWQWRQPCGDPHSVTWGAPWSQNAPGEIVHLHRLGCPGDVDLGPTEELLRVVGRGYPRALPGVFAAFDSDWQAGRVIVTADAGPDDVGLQVVLWTPTTADTHSATSPNLHDVEERVVPGGRIITATVAVEGRYELRVEPRGAAADS